MNCKQGDLAIVVRSMVGNEGLIVRCVKYLGVCRFMDDSYRETWQIDRTINAVGGRTTVAPDAWLRPIRDNDGEDETLTWADKPQEVSA